MVEYHIPALRFTAHRVVPADDDRQGRVLCGDAITTHADLPGCGWCGAMPSVSVVCAWPVHQVPSATWWLHQVPPALCHGCITTACWGHHHVSRRLGISLVRTIALTNVARRRSATTYRRTLSAASRC